MRKKLGMLFLAGFLIRLIAINQSFWLDEAITARVISQFSLFDIPRLFPPVIFIPRFIIFS